MSKKITCLVVFFGLVCLSVAGFVFAQSIQNPLGATDTFSKLLAKIITAVGTVIASLATIMIIVAGILYLTSAGSPEKIKTAKTALIYAIIGIVIGIAASTIAAIITGIIGAPAS